MVSVYTKTSANNMLVRGRGTVVCHCYQGLAKSAGKDFCGGAVAPLERFGILSSFGALLFGPLPFFCVSALEQQQGDGSA
jgi:hypothetical protein